MYRILLRLLLHEPEDFLEHIRYAVGAVIMEVDDAHSFLTRGTPKLIRFFR